MPYRVTKRAAQMRRKRAEVADADMRTDRYRRTDGLRMEIVITRHDTDPPTVHRAELFESGRCDSYLADFDGVRFRKRLGITRAFEWLRKALPRVAGDRARE